MTPKTSSEERVARHPKRPLRKVLGNVSVPILLADETPSGYETTKELLECGHIIRIKSDCFGEYYATRRRCYRCSSGMPMDVSAERLAELAAYFEADAKGDKK